MTVLVNFGISVDHFELGELVADYATEAELEPIVPTGDRVIPYVWITGRPELLDALTEALEASEKTRSVAVLEKAAIDRSSEIQCLYRIEWITDDLDVIRGIVNANGAVLEGASTNGFWRLQLRFPDHQDVAEFYQYLVDNDLTEFHIESSYESEQGANRTQAAWTAEQREALSVAAEDGYFEVPRHGNLEAVGDALGITQQAASERVRRGVRNVVYDALGRPDIYGDSDDDRT